MFTASDRTRRSPCKSRSTASLRCLLRMVARGGVVVYNAAAEYAELCRVAPLIGGPVRNFYFSPLGNHLVTYERWAKDAGANVGVWDSRTGELNFSFVLRKLTDMTWPPLKWTNLETHCCRMVADGVTIMPGSLHKEEADGADRKITAPGIMAFELAPRGAGTSAPHVAICIAESKGGPARCQIFRLDQLSRPTNAKNFYKAQSVAMQWNNIGTAVLVRTSQEVDDTGKSYYGGSHLYFLRADAEESSIVALPDDGAIHDVQWNPTQDEFFLLHGDLPCAMTLHEGKKGQKLWDFGRGHRNTIRWQNFGRFVACGGYGQLLGDTDFWDKPGKRLLGSARLECCVVSAFAPDGRHFMAATTSPRMRVDNKIDIHDYCGQRLTSIGFEELLMASWRPRPRGVFQDRPASPGRGADGKASGGGGAAAAPKKQAYRPPGARGGGGLADLLRKELGSTQAESTITATKVTSGRPAPVVNLVPGAAPEVGGGGTVASRNARRKKAKENAQASATEAGVQERPPAKAALAEPEPLALAAQKPEAPKQAVGSADVPPFSDNPEVEKKVKALRKKLRDIAKLKETEPAKLDKLQRDKIAGEAELMQQLRDLGAEP